MTSAIGRLVVDVLTNKRGSAVAYGDIVVLDSANDNAFTVDTAGAYTGIVGVCIEPNGIANNASGRIQTQGPVAQINCSGSVTRGHYLKTHTVAAQAADAGTSRVVGAFAKTKTTSATPAAILFGFPDAASASASAATPALTLSTTNSAGAASTFVATDATVAVFDATVPVTQAFGDSAAAGSAGVAARRDHKHAMPAAYASSQYKRTAGNYTTTSATFADIDGTNLSITVTTGARRCMIVLQGEIENSSGNTTINFDILVDGASEGGGDGLTAYAVDNGAGYRRSLNLVFITGVLSAGSHTFKAQWKCGAGTTTLYGGTGAGAAPARFSVIELPA